MASGEEQFDDPQLKAALQRQLGAIKAPNGLRVQVESILATTASVQKQPWSWQKSRLVGLAATVVILLSVGSIIYSNLPPSGPQVAYVDIPADLQSYMIARHVACLSSADQGHVHHRGDVMQVVQKLKEQTQQPVIVPVLDRSFQFKTGSVCPIGEYQAAHLQFERDGKNISIFVLPSTACATPPDGSHYEDVENGYAIAAFVSQGSLHAAIASANDEGCSLEDVVPIRNQLLEECSSRQCRGVQTQQSR